MQIKVKLLYDHGGTSDQDAIKGLPTPTIDDSGKVSIGKIQKDDFAFRMNAASRKVLREVHPGLLITKSNVRGGGTCKKLPNIVNINKEEKNGTYA